MTEETSENKRVLLTGAAGRIGTAFREYAGHRYRLRLGVHNLSKLDDSGGHEALQLEVSDLQSCRKACQDMDTVVHLAGTPSPREDFYETLLDNNLLGSYNIFKAARDQGCRRVILGSSVQAVAGYPLDVQVHPDSAVKPLNMYGVCKCFAEAAAHYFAAAEGLSCIVVRIGTFESDWFKERYVARNLSTFISKRDMGHLLVRCIETPGIRFAIAHGVSNNRFKLLDITSTRELLGYRPQDDAFEIFGANLQYSEQWFSGNLGNGRLTRQSEQEKQRD